MFCDHCDRGYHTFCVGLGVLPSGMFADECKVKQNTLHDNYVNKLCSMHRIHGNVNGNFTVFGNHEPVLLKCDVRQAGNVFGIHL